MPTIIKESSNGWGVISNDAPVSWRNLSDWAPGEPLLLQVDDEPTELVAQASIIGIDFPAFTDGRGLSLAVLLRSRYGYNGELRATGAVHEDVLHYMVRCGFDSLQLADGRDEQTALHSIQPYSVHYQGCVRNPEPAFRRVNRGA